MRVSDLVKPASIDSELYSVVGYAGLGTPGCMSHWGWEGVR